MHLPGDGTPSNPRVLNDVSKAASSSEVLLEYLEACIPMVNGANEDNDSRSDGGDSFESFGTMCRKAIASGKQENVVVKRKRSLPLKLRSPYQFGYPTKRQGRSSVKKGIGILQIVF
jgi:hypothetical protein